MNALASEFYRYHHPGERAIKFSAGTTIQRVRYLPGLEWQQLQQQTIWVITLTGIRILCQRTQGSTEIRHSSPDHSNSSRLELDHSGNVLSREDYYPFGGTASWCTRTVAGTPDKIRRYGGKERDITGLSHYGFRYYAPWLMRWLNPDPAETVDGLNLMAFISNNPLTWQDYRGLMRSARSPFSHKTPPPADNRPAQSPTPLPLAPTGRDNSGGYSQSEQEIARALLMLKDVRVSGALSSQPIRPEATNSPKVAISAIPAVAGQSTRKTKRWKCRWKGCHTVFDSQLAQNDHKEDRHPPPSGEKRHKCKCCSQAFYYKFSLSAHNYRQHSNDRPFKCTQCIACFEQRTNLYDHLASHADKAILCKVEGCNTKFKLMKYLKLHFQAKHPKLNFHDYFPAVNRRYDPLCKKLQATR